MDAAGNQADLRQVFQDQLFATVRDGSNATVATTVTWSSDTPALASIDQNGVIRLKHIGPLTPEVLADKIEPLLKKLDA